MLDWLCSFSSLAVRQLLGAEEWALITIIWSDQHDGLNTNSSNCQQSSCYNKVTMPEKTDHFAQISDIEILVPHCSALFSLCNGEVRITIVYTVLE